ncbi:MAG: hypothetical protein EXR28_13560 [Betaproteobacteria bacterium]|nr:hypothetical protein [Betaproteobacteria bacterium]
MQKGNEAHHRHRCGPRVRREVRVSLKQELRLTADEGPTMHRLLRMPVLFAVAICSQIAWSQAPATAPASAGFIGKIVRWIVPFPPGGVADITARILSAQLGPAIGQSIVVENRAGAGGMIGAEIVARGTPDGNLLLIAGQSVPTDYNWGQSNFSSPKPLVFGNFARLGRPRLGGRASHAKARSISSLNRSLPIGQPRLTVSRISLSSRASIPSRKSSRYASCRSPSVVPRRRY